MTNFLLEICFPFIILAQYEELKKLYKLNYIQTQLLK